MAAAHVFVAETSFHKICRLSAKDLNRDKLESLIDSLKLRQRRHDARGRRGRHAFGIRRSLDIMVCRHPGRRGLPMAILEGHGKQASRS